MSFVASKSEMHNHYMVTAVVYFILVFFLLISRMVKAESVVLQQMTMMAWR